MDPLTIADVVAATAGRLVSGDPASVVGSISNDTRSLAPGDLYVAIVGDRLDGNDFVEAALARGACGAIVSRPVGHLSKAIVGGRALIVVPDGTAALQRLARWVRLKSGARVVAVTGSAGKTTTKEVTAAFLETHLRVMRSPGNRNNHIGLPLSLLELRRGADVAVVEIGMNHAGEISRLVHVAEPDVRVWTNVAEVHVEFFQSIDGVADAKAEIMEGAAPDGVLVANGDDPLVMARAPRFAGRLLTFGTTPLAMVSASEIESLGIEGTAALVTTPAGTVRMRVPLLGPANLMNVLAGVAVALQFGVPLAAIADRARTLQPAPHRGATLRLGQGVVVLDDSYNSNPRALRAALAVVGGEHGFSRRVAVVGEMLELGTESVVLHETCGRAAASSGLAELVTVGGDAARALGRAAVEAGLPAAAVRHAKDSDEAAAIAAALVRPGDLVLVKGSRGIGTERVVDHLASSLGPA